MKRKVAFGITFLSIVLWHTSFAQATWEFMPGFKNENALPYLSVAKIAISDTLFNTPEILSKYTFKPAEILVFTPRETDSVYLFKLKVINRTGSNIWLYGPFGGYHIFKHFSVADSNVTASANQGALQPFNNRSIHTNLTVVPIPETNEAGINYYLLVHHAYAPNFGMYAATPEVFTGFVHHADLIAGAYFGLFLLILFYNLVIFFYLRERSNLIYSVWITLNVIALFAYHGVTFEFLWPELPVLNTYVDVYTCLAVLAQVWLNFELFDLKKTSRFFTLSSYFVIAAGGINIMSHFAGFHQQIFPLSDAGVIVLLNGVNTIALSIVMLRRKKAFALYYLLGNLLFFASLIAVLFVAFSPVDFGAISPMTINYFGSAAEILFFALALASRVRMLKEKQEATEQENFALLQRQEKLVREQKEKLEIEVKQRTYEIVEEKKKSDHLLLNILPEEIAEEIKETGKVIPRRYEQATVMFADFKDFSSLAQNLPPEELVAELGECFTAYDKIIAKYSMEKIKTIGDAYLCVSGLPDEKNHDPVKVIAASLEIIDFLAKRKAKRIAEDKPAFEARIGISTGPVVAGVVGINKFAYDIWSNTVNTAARMEQNSNAGRINISGTTYEWVKHAYTCEYRGKIKAKNIGEIDMYFVSAAIK